MPVIKEFFFWLFEKLKAHSSKYDVIEYLL